MLKVGSAGIRDKWGRWDEEGQLAQNIEHVPKPVVCIEETSFPDWMVQELRTCGLRLDKPDTDSSSRLAHSAKWL